MLAFSIPVLAFVLAACGGSGKTSTPPASSPTPAPAAKTPAKPAVEPVARIASLTGKSTSVALDAGFVKALKTLKLTPAPVGGAQITKKGVAVFPITGGNVTYYTPGSISPYVQGMIEHNGSGLSLTSADGKKAELTDFLVDPGKSVLTGKVTVDGKVAAESAPLFSLDGSTLKPLTVNSKGVAFLEGTTVKLKAEAADLLNTTFGTKALTEGLVIGIATIKVNTK